MKSPSTTDIFGRRAVALVTATDYVDWAEGMLLEGHDARHLRMLAGLDRGASVFEGEDLFLRAVRELGLAEPADPLMAHACDLARRLASGELPARPTVRALFKLWVLSDCARRELSEWMALDDALDSLEAGVYPYALPGATPDNFDELARAEARAFLEEHAPPGTSR